MNSRIIGVAQLTLSRVREPAFAILFLFGILVGCIVSEMGVFNLQEEMFLTQLSPDSAEQPILGGFIIVAAISALIGIFTGASEIPKDIDSKLIMIVLGKPVRRTEYLAGKFLGVLAMAAIFFAVSSLSMIISHIIKTGACYPLPLLMRQFSLAYALLPFISLTVAISCFLPEISAMIVSVLYVFSCFMFGAVPILMEILPKSLGFKSPILAIYYFFPNFYYYLIPMSLTGPAQFFMIIYALSTSLIFLTLAYVRLEKMDLA